MAEIANKNFVKQWLTGSHAALSIVSGFLFAVSAHATMKSVSPAPNHQTSPRQ